MSDAPVRTSPVSRLAGTFLLGAYRAFGLVVTPFLPILFARRAARGKEDPSRRGERFGRAGRARPPGRLAWLHAASVGEMNAARPLMQALRARDFTVLLTTGTVTSARIAAGESDPGVIHQFVPYDTPSNFARFLRHWRPDLAITLESEVWPAMIAALAARRIPLVVASASMSERTARGWSRMLPLARAVFSRIPLCLAQTAADAERLHHLGVPRVEICGNLKFDGTRLPVDEDALAALRARIADRPVWLAASTHDGEELLAARVHQALTTDFPALLTIIVPRHPERGDAIAASLAARGLRLSRRSHGELPSPDGDIYLGDTIGEMGLFHRVAPVAFIGKSLVPEGGQNPLEAARLETAILTGPHVFNLQDIYRPLIAAQGAEVVEDADALARALARLLADPELRRARAATAASVVAAGSGALAASLDALTPLLAALPETGR
ncbi:3-deoxy-D-manno-octulosonic acid transferase [Stappia sp. MMSF_3263]|uniref:3-deoxy-D-manno-octulosonic acid transferase n=1 Tax=Stappia sp. MMSF_3263 TaxID=3046693 RepID=UPI00273D1E75|nr:3-deoxy-D-manno-octulosonic acid transferase [Stappia sp. MMSF_3263]